MKLGTFTHTVVVLLLTVTSLFSQSSVSELPFDQGKFGKSERELGGKVIAAGPSVFAPTARNFALAPVSVRQFTWKTNIVTTIFWIGEKPTTNNPTPNLASSWDENWTKNYGGFDNPDPAQRRNLIPANFTPRQNPFYCALPYNDKSNTGHRPEASRVVPWFEEAYQGPAASTLKGRWLAIRKGTKTVYAQWEDAGPFRTDHWQYVFGDERPKPNLNRGAGLDVSPAVRDFLGLQDTDVTDWKFVDFREVPVGPWAKHGDNNTFVINQRKSVLGVAQGRKPSVEIRPR